MIRTRSAWVGLVGLVAMASTGCLDKGGEALVSCARDQDCPGGVCLAGACVQTCNQRSDCAAGFTCQRGVCITDVAVEILANQHDWLSVNGNVETTLSWRVAAAGTYRLVRGADCFSGTTLEGSGTGAVDAGTTQETTIGVAELNSGVNDIRVCLTTAEGDYEAAHTLHRDDTAPTTTASPDGGIFIEPTLLSLSCADNPATIAYSLIGVDPVFGPDGAVLVGTEYTAPVQMDQTGEMRVACRDLAGNVEVARAVSFSLVPVLEVELVAGPVLSRVSNLADQATFSLSSSLDGTFAVMSEGSCERGAPYAGFGGTGNISAGVPELITIEVDSLPNDRDSFALRFCVTEVGGAVNSVLYGVLVDDEVPTIWLPGASDSVCLPASFTVSCYDCAELAYHVGSAPQFDSTGNLTQGTLLPGIAFYGSMQLSIGDFATSGSVDIYFRGHDLAYNFSTVSMITYDVLGETPMVSFAPLGEPTVSIYLSANHIDQVEVQWNAPDGLAFTFNDVDCAGAATALSVSSNSGTTSGSGNSTIFAAADLPPPASGLSTQKPVALCVLDAGGLCPSPWTRVYLSRADDFAGASSVSSLTSLVPQTLAMYLAGLAGGSIATTTRVSLALDDTSGVLPVAGLAATDPVRDDNFLLFDLPGDRMPEYARFEVTMIVDGDVVDRAGNPVAGTYVSTLITYGVEETFPLGNSFGASTVSIADATTQLTWSSCAVGQDTSCAGAPTTFDYPAAIMACEALNTAGHGGRSDWRLPVLRELLTLLDPAVGAAPFIDPLFGGTAGRYWTASAGGYEAEGFAHAVDFASREISLEPYTTDLVVRCVAHDAPPSILDGTIGHWDESREFLGPGPVFFDRVRQRGWDFAAPNEMMSWADAAELCATFSTALLGGSDGWRLPTIKELAALGEIPFYVLPGPEGVAAEDPAPMWSSEDGPAGEKRGIDFRPRITESFSRPADNLAFVRCVTEPPTP